MSPPRGRSLTRRADSRRLIAIENPSGLTDYVNDQICRLSAEQPVLMNGCPDLARRADLADRALVLNQLPRSTRALDTSAFIKAQPAILGFLYSAIAVGLQKEGGAEYGCFRMADFAAWGTAVAPALGWTPEAFSDAYQGHIRDVEEFVLNNDPVAVTVIELAEEHSDWAGTGSQLLANLRRKFPKSSEPQKPSALRSRLRCLVPALRELRGIEVSFSNPVRAPQLIRASVQIGNGP